MYVVRVSEVKAFGDGRAGEDDVNSFWGREVGASGGGGGGAWGGRGEDSRGSSFMGDWEGRGWMMVASWVRFKPAVGVVVACSREEGAGGLGIQELRK